MWIDDETRERITRLAESLRARNESLLSRCARTKKNGREFYALRDMDGQTIVFIPVEEVQGGNPKRSLLAILGFGCAVCEQPLIDGEDVLCGTCEASEVMGLLRLRERFS